MSLIINTIYDEPEKEMMSNEFKAEIDNLKEYKQRLIADVVTGQVNVS